MNKRQQAKTVQPDDRIFPNDYTRDDLISYLVSTGAENYDLSEQIDALAQRVSELQQSPDR